MWYLLLLLATVNAFTPTNKVKIEALNALKGLKKTTKMMAVNSDNLNEKVQELNAISDSVITQLDYRRHPSDIIKDLLSEPKFGDEWSFSQMLEEIKRNNVDGLTITDTGNTAIAIDGHHLPMVADIHGTNLHTVKMIPQSYNTLVDFLVSHHVNFDVLDMTQRQIPPIFQMIGQGAITVGIYVMFAVGLNMVINYFRMRGPGGGPGMPLGSQMPGRPSLPGGGGFNGIGGPNLNSFWEGDPKDPPLTTRFEDVAGCDEAKFELQEVVDFLKNPEKYNAAGAKMPKGVLLEGSPGTGKTLLAKAVAGEAEVPFISASGSEFIEMFVGLGASRVRQLFKQAKDMAPCVVFIDEIDAVGRQRGTGISGGSDEREQTLNQILTNMDGFTETEGIVVLAATNRADILDNALTRPGRFDRKIKVPLPDKEGRKAISKVHFRNKKLSKDVDLDELAVLTSGFSGAELANLANEAAIFQVRKNKTEIDKDTLYQAYEKITIGLQSNVQVKDLDIVELVANHEIGHALMAALFPDFFDVRKVTINENKSGMGGYTLFTPKDRFLKYASKKYILANLIVCLGGRAAEVYHYRKKSDIDDFDKLVFGDYSDLDVTTGASNDLLQANKIAKDYIARYGFGDDFGQYDETITTSQPFIGRDLGMNSRGMSESTRKNLDDEVAKLVKYAYNKAVELIELHGETFEELVELIKEKRVIDKGDIKEIMEKEI